MEAKSSWDTFGKYIVSKYLTKDQFLPMKADNYKQPTPPPSCNVGKSG